MQVVAQCWATIFSLWFWQAHGSYSSSSAESDEQSGDAVCVFKPEFFCRLNFIILREDLVAFLIGLFDFCFLRGFFFPLPFFDFFFFEGSPSSSSSSILLVLSLFSFRMSENMDSLVWETLKKLQVCSWYFSVKTLGDQNRSGLSFSTSFLPIG